MRAGLERDGRAAQLFDPACPTTDDITTETNTQDGLSGAAAIYVGEKMVWC